MTDWFVYDPEFADDSESTFHRDRPALIGPFATREAAEEYANVSHPEDGSGNTVVLRAEKP